MDVPPVELHPVDMQAVQVLERGEAGAEIVEADLMPEIPKLLQDTVRALDVLQLARFGDLEGEAAREPAVAPDEIQQGGHEDVVLQRLRRKIDRDDRIPPSLRLPEPLDDGFADGQVHLVDEMHALGELDHLVRALLAVRSEEHTS